MPRMTGWNTYEETEADRRQNEERLRLVSDLERSKTISRLLFKTVLGVLQSTKNRKPINTGDLEEIINRVLRLNKGENE